MNPGRTEQLLAFIKEDPTDPFLRYALALEWIKTGEIQKGIQILKDLRTTDPLYLPQYYQLAFYLSENGEKKQAVEVLESGIIVAQQQKDSHTLGELSFLLDELSDQ